MSTPVTEKNFASRNRKRQSEFRKRQLIDATIDCISRLGISQTTLARIAAQAGLSQGNVVFHFHSKDALFEQTLRFLDDEYRGNWEQAVANAGENPYLQLKAMLEAAFAPHIFTRRKISVWFAFWGESRSRPQYMEVCGASDRVFSARLLSLCEQIERRHGARLGARVAALAFEGMIDGLWQNFLIGENAFKRKQAIASVCELLESVYPGIDGKEPPLM